MYFIMNVVCFPLLRILLTLVAVASLTTSSRADYGDMLKEFDFGVAEVKRDNTRDRVYVASPSTNTVKVIDSNSLAVLASIFTGSAPLRMELSADSSRLYVANSGSTVQGIAVVNLSTLTIEKHISTYSYPRDVAISSNGRLFVLFSSEMRIYDAETGDQLGDHYDTYSSPSFTVYGGNIESMPGKQKMIYYQTGLSPSSWSVLDVTTNPFSISKSGSWGSNGQGMSLSADGNYVTFVSGAPYQIAKLDASNPTSSYGTFNTGAYPRGATYSPDGRRLYAVHTSGHIDVWNAQTYVQLPQIPNSGEARILECDRRNRVLFAGSQGANGYLRVIYINEAAPAEEINLNVETAMHVFWDSKRGELYQVQWRHSLVGNDPWYDLGDPVLGNGLTMSVYDKLRGMKRKFYRVVVVTGNP